FSSRRRHTRSKRDWSSDVCSSDLGLSADSAGNVYVAIGNGTFDAYAGGANYGDSFIKLTLNGSSLSVTDYFTPFNQQTLSDEDRSEEHTSELQSRFDLVCRLLLEK